MLNPIPTERTYPNTNLHTCLTLTASLKALKQCIVTLVYALCGREEW